MVALLVVGGIVVVVGGVFAIAATKPPRFRIVRTIAIAAPVERVVALVDDLRSWPSWSDDGTDATVTRTYEGAPRGVGAIGRWDSKGRAGKGRMEIVEASRELVRVNVDWERPFAARNVNDFAFAPSDGGTLVTWTLDGENLYILKVMTVVLGLDRLMGRHLEQGLAALKRAGERA
jgi:hypothetical protein